jgi:hypothetical protein
MPIIDSSPTLSMVWPHNSHTKFDIYTPIKVIFALPKHGNEMDSHLYPKGFTIHSIFIMR